LLPYKDHFAVDEGTMQKIFSLALSRGGSFCDLFFEHTLLNQITMEEGIVKQGELVIAHGMGIRVVKGEGTGYAYTEDATFEKMKEAALTAAAISEGKTNVGPVALASVPFMNRYPIGEPTTGTALKRKIAWIEEAERAAREFDSRIVKVSVSIADDLSAVQIATSDGNILRDMRPMLRFVVNVVAETNGNRQVGTSSGGGRIGNEYFTTRMSPAEHGREAARQAILLLGAVDAPAGPMELILSHAESGVLLHETVGHPLEADFIRKGTSAYTNRIGHKVASDLVTVIDNGTIPNDRGSINFDDEGTVTSSTVLIDKGILRGFMHDRISATLFGVPPTGNGRRESYKHPPAPRMTVTYLANGESDPEEILRSTRKGIFCKSFRGGYFERRFRVRSGGGVSRRERPDRGAGQEPHHHRERPRRPLEGDHGRKRPPDLGRPLDLRQGAARSRRRRPADDQDFRDHRWRKRDRLVRRSGAQ
jgi:TldD protein